MLVHALPVGGHCPKSVLLGSSVLMSRDGIQNTSRAPVLVAGLLSLVPTQTWGPSHRWSGALCRAPQCRGRASCWQAADGEHGWFFIQVLSSEMGLARNSCAQSLWVQRQGAGSVHLIRDVCGGFPRPRIRCLASSSSAGTAWLFQMGLVVLTDVRP